MPEEAETAAETRQEAAQGELGPDPAPAAVDGDTAPENAAKRTVKPGEVVKVDGDPKDVVDPDDFKPEPQALVALDPDDAFRAMDRADELQILDELQGRALEVMVYSFTQQGKRLTDLSYAGVREVVRTLNTRGYTAIRVGAQPPLVDEIVENDESYYRVMVYAEDSRTGSGQWGTAVEPKHIQKRNGERPWDKFALTKALNKAQRNAMKALLPLEFQQTVVAQYLGDASKVRQIRVGSGAEKTAELPAPLDDAEAKGLLAQIHERYDELKGLNRLAMVPAAFNDYLTRSAHDHVRLRDMLAHVESLLEQEQEKAYERRRAEAATDTEEKAV